MEEEEEEEEAETEQEQEESAFGATTEKMIDLQGGALLQLLCETNPDHLRALDSEGRCVITDHGDFVLFNCYFPATRFADKFDMKLDEDRFLFKVRFNLFLHIAIARLREKGRRVVLVGDLNISLNREDTCDPDTSDDFEKYAMTSLYLRPPHFT